MSQSVQSNSFLWCVAFGCEVFSQRNLIFWTMFKWERCQKLSKLQVRIISVRHYFNSIINFWYLTLMIREKSKYVLFFKKKIHTIQTILLVYNVSCLHKYVMESSLDRKCWFFFYISLPVRYLSIIQFQGLPWTKRKNIFVFSQMSTYVPVQVPVHLEIRNARNIFHVEHLRIYPITVLDSGNVYFMFSSPNFFIILTFDMNAG